LKFESLTRLRFSTSNEGGELMKSQTAKFFFAVGYELAALFVAHCLFYGLFVKTPTVVVILVI